MRVEVQDDLLFLRRPLLKPSCIQHRTGFVGLFLLLLALSWPSHGFQQQQQLQHHTHCVALQDPATTKSPKLVDALSQPFHHNSFTLRRPATLSGGRATSSYSLLLMQPLRATIGEGRANELPGTTTAPERSPFARRTIRLADMLETDGSSSSRWGASENKRSQNLAKTIVDSKDYSPSTIPVSSPEEVILGEAPAQKQQQQVRLPRHWAELRDLVKIKEVGSAIKLPRNWAALREQVNQSQNKQTTTTTSEASSLPRQWAALRELTESVEQRKSSPTTTTRTLPRQWADLRELTDSAATPTKKMKEEDSSSPLLPFFVDMASSVASTVKEAVGAVADSSAASSNMAGSRTTSTASTISDNKDDALLSKYSAIAARQREATSDGPVNLFQARSLQVSAAASAGKSRWGAAENLRADLIASALASPTPVTTTAAPQTTADQTVSADIFAAAAAAAAAVTDDSTSAPTEQLVAATTESTTKQEVAVTTPKDMDVSVTASPPQVDAAGKPINLFQARSLQVSAAAAAGKSRWGATENRRADLIAQALATASTTTTTTTTTTPQTTPEEAIVTTDDSATTTTTTPEQVVVATTESTPTEKEVAVTTSKETDVSVAAPPPVEVGTAVKPERLFQARTLQVAAAAAAGKSRWGTPENRRAGLFVASLTNPKALPEPQQPRPAEVSGGLAVRRKPRPLVVESGLTRWSRRSQNQRLAIPIRLPLSQRPQLAGVNSALVKRTTSVTTLQGRPTSFQVGGGNRPNQSVPNSRWVKRGPLAKTNANGVNKGTIVWRRVSVNQENTNDALDDDRKRRPELASKADPNNAFLTRRGAAGGSFKGFRSKSS